MLDDRITRLGQALQAEGLDAVALIPGPTLTYLTALQFHLMERPMIGLFSAKGAAHLVLPDFERSKADECPLMLHLHTYGEQDQERLPALRAAIKALSLERGRIGVEPLGMRFYESQLLLEAAPEGQFRDASAVLSSLRVRKEEVEIAAMRRAVRIAEKALLETLPLVKIGMTERELASELMVQLLRAGSQGELPFEPIVAAGPNSALPHAVPSERPLQAGDLLLIDWGARWEGYVSDLTRVFALGEVDAKLQEIHGIVLRANQAGREASQPGATCESVDKAARSIIEAAGYGPHFTHRTGHGIGMEAHEAPYIVQGNTQALDPGMAFTVEPGIYLQELGGVRIEDDVVITPEGHECLSVLERELKPIA